MRIIEKEHLTWDIGIGRHHVERGVSGTSGIEYGGYPLTSASPVVDDAGMRAERCA